MLSTCYRFWNSPALKSQSLKFKFRISKLLSRPFVLLRLGSITWRGFDTRSSTRRSCIVRFGIIGPGKNVESLRDLAFMGGYDLVSIMRKWLITFEVTWYTGESRDGELGGNERPMIHASIMKQSRTARTITISLFRATEIELIQMFWWETTNLCAH